MQVNKTVFHVLTILNKIEPDIVGEAFISNLQAGCDVLMLKR